MKNYIVAFSSAREEILFVNVDQSLEGGPHFFRYDFNTKSMHHWYWKDGVFIKQPVSFDILNEKCLYESTEQYEKFKNNAINYSMKFFLIEESCNFDELHSKVKDKLNL